MKLNLDNTNNTEISIIDSAELIGDQIKLTLKNNLVNNHLSNISDLNGRSFIPYATVVTTSEISKDGNVFKFEVDNTNSKYNNVENGDYLLFDWGKQREVINVGTIPFKIKNNPNDISNLQFTTAVYKITDLEENNTNTVKTISIVNPKIFYPVGTRIIILKNPFKSKINLQYPIILCLLNLLLLIMNGIHGFFIKVPLTILVVILMLHIKKIIFSLILKIDMSVEEHPYLTRIIQILYYRRNERSKITFLRS